MKNNNLAYSWRQIILSSISIFSSPFPLGRWMRSRWFEARPIFGLAPTSAIAAVDFFLPSPPQARHRLTNHYYKAAGNGRFSHYQLLFTYLPFCFKTDLRHVCVDLVWFFMNIRSKMIVQWFHWHGDWANALVVPLRSSKCLVVKASWVQISLGAGLIFHLLHTFPLFVEP